MEKATDHGRIKFRDSLDVNGNAQESWGNVLTNDGRVYVSFLEEKNGNPTVSEMDIRLPDEIVTNSPEGPWLELVVKGQRPK